MPKSMDTIANGNRLVAIVIAILGAGIGGGGSTYYLLAGGMGQIPIQQIARPDPYTGTMGQALEIRIDLFETRLVRLETQYQEILRNQDRILQRLE